MTYPVAHPFIVRVYYEDTDFSGVVYHASYLRFLERGRTELLRGAGFSNREMAKADGVAFAVRRLQIDYLSPAFMDDLLKVATRVERVGGASLEFAQQIVRDDMELVVAKVRVAVLRGGRPVRIPVRMREVFMRAKA
jgi:acyl-CoA thioester hydrolase